MGRGVGLGGIGRSGGSSSMNPPRSDFFSVSCSFSDIWQNRILTLSAELDPPPIGNYGFSLEGGGAVMNLKHCCR